MPTDDLSGLFEQLDFLGEVEKSSDDFYNMPLPDLYHLIKKLDDELGEMGELMQQRTQKARDLHSRRGAAMVAYKNRTLFKRNHDHSDG